MPRKYYKLRRKYVGDRYESSCLWRPGKKALEERPRPEIEENSDAIVHVLKTTICGTDLHILKGDVPTCKPGRILGHEGVGIVEKVGAGVS